MAQSLDELDLEKLIEAQARGEALPEDVVPIERTAPKNAALDQRVSKLAMVGRSGLNAAEEEEEVMA